MIKAFLDQATLIDLYEKLNGYHDTLETLKTQGELSFEDSLLYEVTCFSLPMLDDYFSDNLFSMANYLRYRGIIEACTLLSLNSEKDFHKINSNLLQPQKYIFKKRTYDKIVPNYIDEKEVESHFSIAKDLIEFSIEKDWYHSYKLKTDVVLNQKFPILLGRNLLESIRFYLGYIYENIYVKSGEMIHLIDYRDLNDKYSLTFFNDVSRMLLGMINQCNWSRDIVEKQRSSLDRKQLEKVYLNEFFALKSTIFKIETKYGECFISQAFYQLIKLEKSVENSLINDRHFDLNPLYKLAIEWIVNVDSLTDSTRHLTNFNFDGEIAKLGKLEREFKFAAMKRNLIKPNLNWQNDSLEKIVDSYVDSSKKNVKTYCGLSNRDYLKLKYREARICSHGNGFLALAENRFFSLDKEILLNINDLLKETIKKITETFSRELDLTVEEQILIEALDQKYTFLMNM